MKKTLSKYILLSGLILSVLFCGENVNATESTNTVTINNDSLYERTKGKIILKVEENGEAYYVHPSKKEMYFLSRPSDAFRVLREQGIGITNNDLARIEIGFDINLSDDGGAVSNEDLNFARKHVGKIFLQVEEDGEAWYINYVDAKRYFLGKPTNVFNVMKMLGMGVSNGDFKKMKENDWKTYQNDEYSFEFKYPKTLIEKNGQLWNEVDYKRIFIEKDLSVFGDVPNFQFSINKKEIEGKIELERNEFDDFILLKNRTSEQIGCFYYIERNDFSIEFATVSDCSKTTMIDEIISTFKFTDDKVVLDPFKNSETGIELKDDGNIYFYNDKRGYIKDGEIFISFKDDVILFNGNLEKITPYAVDGPENFYYNGLEVSTTFKGPYAVYTNLDQITYFCDEAMLRYNDLDFMGLGRKKINFQYCETNEKDMLTQFEFSAADGIGFATGGEAVEKWYKLYIRKISGRDFIFIGKLKGEYVNTHSENNEEFKERISYISSKKYLDEVLEDEENKERIKEWDRFVDLFDVVK